MKIIYKVWKPRQTPPLPPQLAFPKVIKMFLFYRQAPKIDYLSQRPKGCHCQSKHLHEESCFFFYSLSSCSRKWDKWDLSLGRTATTNKRNNPANVQPEESMSSLGVPTEQGWGSICRSVDNSKAVASQRNPPQHGWWIPQNWITRVEVEFLCVLAAAPK